jgi:hypothetical protein
MRERERGGLRGDFTDNKREREDFIDNQQRTNKRET